MSSRDSSVDTSPRSSVGRFRIVGMFVLAGLDYEVVKEVEPDAFSPEKIMALTLRRM